MDVDLTAIIQALTVMTLAGLVKWGAGVTQNLQKQHEQVMIHLTRLQVEVDGHVKLDKILHSEIERRVVRMEEN